MTSLWWWALPVLLLPLWWHRQRRRQVKAAPLATARFLPRAEPRQLRAWRIAEPLLLLVRCLLLIALIAWLADPVVAWRGDTVLVAAGGKSAEPRAIQVPSRDAIGWLRAREAEFKPAARIVVTGPQNMAATEPRLRHGVTLQPQAAPPVTGERHVAIVSAQPAPWRALFASIDGPIRYVIDAAPGLKTELIVWDRPDTPPLPMRAPLWWIVQPAAFPVLKDAPRIDGIRYAESEYGTLWSAPSWPPRDPAAARTLFETWQRLRYPPLPYVAPAQALAADPRAPLAPLGGALRDKLLLALVALLALERMMAHVRKS